jgi:diaminopimelate decarboxylase
VDPKTHVYITTGTRENKFGIDLERAGRLLRWLPALRRVRLLGLHMHIGSQITQAGPHAQALGKIVRFLEGHRGEMPDLEFLNIGGGFGILYDLEDPATVRDFAARIAPLVRKTGLRLVMEPGRLIVGNAGILLTRVVYVKESGADKRFVICDAAMNDLVRPTMYDAYHRIWPARTRRSLYVPSRNGVERVDVVGPICESGDFLARDRWLPPVRRGDLLAVFSAGAYGHTMSSNYNARPRACEVLVSGERFRVVRRRETYDDLILAEK